MTFPQTRITLIQRLVGGGSDDDWREFLNDYWGPVFRFCLRRGINRSVAEEISSDIFAILATEQVLARWQSNRAAKLRTLVCAVARNLIAQWRRRPQPLLIDAEVAVVSSDEDCFYEAWAEDLLRRSLDAVAADYRREGQGDYLRVYLGRACEGLSIRDVAQSLSLSESAVDHHYRHVRDRLQEELRRRLHQQTAQYCGQDADAECAREWQRLHSHLQQRGDFEQVLRESLAEIDRAAESDARNRGIQEAVTRLTQVRLSPPKPGSASP